MAELDKPVAWVTGAAGFIGRNVADHLANQNWSVIGVDRSAAPGIQIAGDVSPATLTKALELSGPPALVFHGAGGSSVGESLRDPAASLRDTVTATGTLLDFLLARAPAAKMVFPSSAAVYGATDAGPLAEDRPANPVSPYGHHKLASEGLCVAAARRGLQVAVVRLFSVYGPGLRKQLPWELAQKLRAGGQRVELFGTGAETRDFLHVEDVAALTAFLAQARLEAPLIVNGGTGLATRIDMFARTLAGSLGVPAHITFNAQIREGDPQHYCADTARLRALGFTSKVGLESGLAGYADWILTQGQGREPMTTRGASEGMLTGGAALEVSAANSHSRFNGGANGATQRMQARTAVAINLRPKFKLTAADTIFTMGSCFARNVEHALVAQGLRVLPENFDFPLELLAPKAAELARASVNAPLHYRVIVRAVLNKYSPLSMLNEFQRVLEPERHGAPQKGLIQVDDDRWYDPQAKDTGMHGLKNSLMVRFLIEKASQEVRQASAVFLTLGLTETWLDGETGMVLNFAPPPLLIKKWPQRFRFFNATYTDVLDSLEQLHQLITRTVRPDMKFVVTVSPVPLNATFTANDVITANSYSKATLRAAADAFCARHANADYFPSYEMVMATNPDMAWQPDRIHVAHDLVDFVIGRFVAGYVEAGTAAN